MDCTFCVLRMSAHQILTMCSLFSYVHYDILSICCVLRATSSSPTLLQPRAVSPGVGAVLQPHKASRRPHSHSSGPGLIPSFPDLFQVHYTMYCTLGCSFVGLCVRNVRMHMQNCVCVRMYGHTCTCHFSNSICRCEILYSTLSMHINFLHYILLLLQDMLFTGHEYPHFLWA